MTIGGSGKGRNEGDLQASYGTIKLHTVPLRHHVFLRQSTVRTKRNGMYDFKRKHTFIPTFIFSIHI